VRVAAATRRFSFQNAFISPRATPPKEFAIRLRFNDRAGGADGECGGTPNDPKIDPSISLNIGDRMCL
jgi:hypothetical protein